MKQLQVVIADDEPPARENLRDLLAVHPEVRIVGEAGTVKEARNILGKFRPDVIFLDIQMPGGTGFDVLSGLKAPVKVVFVTAYDTYAIRAFQVNAIDYLLKPIDRELLAGAIQRLMANLVLPLAQKLSEPTEDPPFSINDEVWARTPMVRNALLNPDSHEMIDPVNRTFADIVRSDPIFQTFNLYNTRAVMIASSTPERVHVPIAQAVVRKRTDFIAALAGKPAIKGPFIARSSAQPIISLSINCQPQTALIETGGASQQVMIWDSETLNALQGLKGCLMFSTHFRPCAPERPRCPRS